MDKSNSDRHVPRDSDGRLPGGNAGSGRAGLLISPGEKFPAMIVADLLTGKRVSRAHIQEMDDPIPTKFAGFLISVSAAATAAFTVGYVAHYDLGLSRLDIRTLALIGAAIIALLLATEYFGKMLRKTK